MGATSGQGRQAGGTPRAALADLLAGNRRFVSGQPVHGHDVTAAAAASGDQQPYAVVLGCIDSRVPLEAIFDQTFGAICVIRTGGTSSIARSAARSSTWSASSAYRW